MTKVEMTYDTVKELNFTEDVSVAEIFMVPVLFCKSNEGCWLYQREQVLNTPMIKHILHLTNDPALSNSMALPLLDGINYITIFQKMRCGFSVAGHIQLALYYINSFLVNFAPFGVNDH